MTFSADLEKWRVGVRATLAKFEQMDPDEPPEGMSGEEWGPMLEGFKAGCRRLIATNMDRVPSEEELRTSKAEVERMLAQLDDGLTDRGGFDA